MSNARNLADAETRFVNASGDTVSGNLIVDGNVGIGTSSPAQKLHVGGAGSALAFDKNGSGSDNAIYYDNTTASNNIYFGRDSSNVIFRTSVTERMRIDPAGRVTMPYQPGFHAYNGSTTPADPIVWSNTYFNDVSIYNTSTGRMTVPTGANGKWLITFHTGFLNPAGVAFFIKKNGVTWVGYDMGTGSGWWQHAGTVIISLVAGDYITTAWSGSAASFDNGVWSSFQGQFLG